MLLAPATGFEPVTLRLTAECSTAELRRNTQSIIEVNRLFVNAYFVFNRFQTCFE